MTLGERRGLTLALALMAYALITRDVPLVMLTGGYVCYGLRQPVAESCGESAGKAVRAFGLTLCAGAFAVALL